MGQNFYEVINHVIHAGLIAALSIVVGTQHTRFLKREYIHKAIIKENNYVKDRIFAILGHDLRKPVLAFRGLSKKLSYLIERKDFDTLNRVGENLQADANALHNLIDNILNWAMLQKESNPFQPSVLPVHDAVEDAVGILQRASASKNIRLENQTNIFSKVFADHNAISTILRNVVDNAIKYTPEGGSVIISSSTTEKEILLKVKDSGVGMNQTQLEKLFELTRNKSCKGTRGEKGTGLGMHLVSELVDLQNGKIYVDSVLNEGTTFTIHLPRPLVAHSHTKKPLDMTHQLRFPSTGLAYG